jgi:5'-nucleotidase
LIIACSTSRVQTNPEIEQSPQSSADIEMITILGTNDIHGTITPLELKSREARGVDSIKYKAGGVAYLASYVKKLRKELGNRLLWLDAGDEFQGSIESNSNYGAAMVKFFNTVGLDAAAVGNHEFDFAAGADADQSDRLANLKDRMRQAHYPYLAANIYDRKTEHLADFPNTAPSKLFDVGRVKVGVIGLSTRTTPTTTRPENVQTLSFGNLKVATLREAKKLRNEGAEIIVITAHVGQFCDLLHSPPGHILRRPSLAQGACDPNDEMSELLRSLPPGTVDAVVSGHSHTVVHHYIAGVPVIQGGAYGRYFNLIHLAYNLKEHHLVKDLTAIEGPVPVCPKIFKNQGDCNGDRPAPSIGRGPLVRPTFRRETIRADHDAQAAIQPAIDAAKKIRETVYGKAIRPLEHIRNGESPLGDLIADSVRKAANSDFAFVNSGGIRAPIEQGTITYGNIFRTLPFDNAVVVLNVTGKQLKYMIRIAESGSRGFHPISGLKARLIAPAYDAPADDLNHNGKIEPWEINRLLELETSDGTSIDDHKTYTVATIDFLVSGGDDYGWIMNQIPQSKRHTLGLLLRDVTANYIRQVNAEQGGINSPEHPLLDPAKPRLVFEKPKAKSKRRRRRHHPRRHSSKRRHRQATTT